MGCWAPEPSASPVNLPSLQQFETLASKGTKGSPSSPLESQPTYRSPSFIIQYFLTTSSSANWGEERDSLRAKNQNPQVSPWF